MRTKPAPAPALTPAQIAAREETERAYDLADAREAALIARATEVARQLAPAMGGTVHPASGAGFYVMFGASERSLGFAGPGLVEIKFDAASLTGADIRAGVAPMLRACPRAYSLSTNATIADLGAQGAAMVEAAQFARALLALV